MLTKQILEAQPGKILVKNPYEKLVGITFVAAAVFVLVSVIVPAVIVAVVVCFFFLVVAVVGLFFLFFFSILVLSSVFFYLYYSPVFEFNVIKNWMFILKIKKKLDLSKTEMYEFYFDYIKKTW